MASLAGGVSVPGPCRLPDRHFCFIPDPFSSVPFPHEHTMPPVNPKFGKFAKKKAKPRAKVKRRDPIYIDGARPRPMYVDYKDLELLGKLVNRQAKILGRRKSGCTAASQHAVTSAIKRARFMALLPYVGE